MMNGGEKKNELNMNDSVYIAESSSLSFIYMMCMHEGSENNAWDQNRRELIMNEQPLMGMSSRWSPTPKQLLALEEMYRRGTRTPKAEQIQQIAAQLRRFGKIEGKNVFYWFQNHKARERQKRRRAVEASRKVLKHDITGSLDMKESVELQKKTLVPPSSCSENLEGHVSINTAGTTESTTSHGCLQIEKRESNQCKSCSLEKKTKWLAVDPCPSYPTHLINNMTTRSSRFLNSQRQSSWFKSNRRTENDENKIGEVETLDLFPLCSEDCSGVNGSKNDTEVAITAINTKLMSPNQYFEFLPLKN